MEGFIPTEIGMLKNLTSLDLFHNGFIGDIPQFIAELKGLKFLNLADNKLSGVIPSQILELSNLDVLLLRNNDFDNVLKFNQMSRDHSNEYDILGTSTLILIPEGQ